MIPANKIETALMKKGFKKDSGRDHIYFIYRRKDGCLSQVRTKISHSAKDIADNLISQMAKQCKLTNKDFKELVGCSLSQDDFERLIFPVV